MSQAKLMPMRERRELDMAEHKRRRLGRLGRLPGQAEAEARLLKAGVAPRPAREASARGDPAEIERLIAWATERGAKQKAQRDEAARAKRAEYQRKAREAAKWADRLIEAGTPRDDAYRAADLIVGLVRQKPGGDRKSKEYQARMALCDKV